MSRCTPTATSPIFIRFVVSAPGECADRIDRLFVHIRALRDESLLEPYESTWLDELYAWFNAELPCPPFSREQFPADAVSWFRSSATRFVTRMWDLAALLREHGQPVKMLKSDDPGVIVYQDDYQVVAHPRTVRRQRSRHRSRRRHLGRRRNCSSAAHFFALGNSGGEQGPIFTLNCNVLANYPFFGPLFEYSAPRLLPRFSAGG
jgi:hypothetical protein